MSGGSPQTTVSQNGPPQVFLDAYGRVVNRAEQVAATPYEAYPGQTVAGFSPDQTAAMGVVRGAQGISAPYINQAADYIDQSTGPLLNGVPQLSQNLLQGQVASSLQNLQQATGSGITDAAGAGSRGIMDAAGSFTPQSIAPWMSPYTESVVDATRRQFGRSNEQQRQGVVGNAISRGAWGGDRSAVAEAILAGEQQMSQAPVLAGLMDRGYQSGLGAAQNAAQLRTQGATSAGNLGFQGAANDAQQRQAAAAQLLGLFTGQQGLGFNANQAQAQLAQQAGYGMAGLGREAQSSTLTGAQALAGMGALQQEQAQRQLNVPYQQFMAAQQYPFQTTGWLSNIASGLGGASGGTKTETAPGPSTLSQLGGLGATALGAIGGTGGFGANGWLSGLGGGGYGGPDAVAGGGWDMARGGGVPYAKGGEIDADYEWLPDAGVPDLTLSIVPGADGMRVIAPGTGRGGLSNLMQSTGTTSTTSGGGGPMSSILGLAGTVAGSFLPFPGGSMIGGMAGRALGSAFAEGGGVPMVDMVAGTRPGSRIPRLNFGPPGQGLGAGVPQFAPGELPVLQQAMAGLGGNGGVDDYLAGQMKGASFAKPNFYVPPPPAAPAAASPVSTMDSMQAIRNAILEWERIGGGPEGGGGSGAGDNGPGSGGPADAPDNMGGSDMGGYRSGGIVRRAKGGFTDYEEDMPLPPMPPEDDLTAETRELEGMESGGDGDISGLPVARSARPAGSDGPGFMAAGNPWNALMYAGLGTMGGNSPNALTNIGRGALAGLEQFGKERTTAEALAARRANASAMERYRMQTADIAAKRLANQERKTDADIKRSEAQTNKLVAAVGAAGSGGGGGRAKVTWDPAIMLDADGKPVSGYNMLSNNGDPPKWFPAAQARALVAEAGRNTRAEDRGDFQQRVLDFRVANAADLADIKKEGAATARFAAENKLTIDQARLVLEEAKEQGRNTRAENAEAGKGARAATRADLQERALDFRVANAAELADIKRSAAATARFAAENKLTIDQARLALAGTKQQAQSVGARERSIMDMVKVLAANPVYYRKTPEELRAMAVAAVGAGGGGDAPASAPAAAAKPQPTPEQAAQAIRIAKKAVAGGFPKEEAIKRLRASGVTVPDDF